MSTGLDFLDHIDKKEARRMDRFTQYAVVAAREAVKDMVKSVGEEVKDDGPV